MASSFLVKNSPCRPLPLPTPGQASFCSGGPRGDHDLAGSRVIVQNVLRIVRELKAAVLPQAKLPPTPRRVKEPAMA